MVFCRRKCRWLFVEGSVDGFVEENVDGFCRRKCRWFCRRKCRWFFVEGSVDGFCRRLKFSVVGFEKLKDSPYPHLFSDSR